MTSVLIASGLITGGAAFSFTLFSDAEKFYPTGVGTSPRKYFRWFLRRALRCVWQ